MVSVVVFFCCVWVVGEWIWRISSVVSLVGIVVSMKMFFMDMCMFSSRLLNSGLRIELKWFMFSV